MYVCGCGYVFTCACVFLSGHVCLCACLYVYVSVSLCVCVHVCVSYLCVCIFVLCVCVHICIYLYVNACLLRVYICVYLIKLTLQTSKKSDGGGRRVR